MRFELAPIMQARLWACGRGSHLNPIPNYAHHILLSPASFESHRHACMPCEVFMAATKGQLISKCPFGVIKSLKKPAKFFPGFLP